MLKIGMFSKLSWISIRILRYYDDQGLLAPVRIASATFKGPYEQEPEVIQTVAKWVRDNGCEFDGPFFSIYHVSPHETKNPEEYVTGICFTVRKK